MHTTNSDEMAQQDLQTPLHYACFYSAPLDTIMALVDKDANVNALDSVSDHSSYNSLDATG